MADDDDLPSLDNDRENPYNVTQASRIYFLPNLMTAGNLFCGFMAIIWCIRARYDMIGVDALMPAITPAASELFTQAVWFIFGAMAFDMLDGRLARMGGRESLFGAEFDSLADVVSFGVAPALMVFFLILSPTQGYPVFRNIGGLLGFVYLLCAAIRLARFNVITNPLLHQHRDTKPSSKEFIGLPVPAAAGTVASLVLFLLNLAAHDRSLQHWALALPPLLLLIAMLMVSTVRYPSGKQIDMQTKTRLTTFVLFGVIVAAVVAFKEYGMFIACLGYIFFGLIRHWRKHGLTKRAPLV
ncbi:MAG: CDP-diacylglycerol--serine O-phosphatidyltransferase [Verrucomicrobia bacterium]|nr:CDP-diacylglycerol--serine O-phosphatidyltransferase [Verrucomicrobiota bacterium]